MAGDIAWYVGYATFDSRGLGLPTRVHVILLIFILPSISRSTVSQPHINGKTGTRPHFRVIGCRACRICACGLARSCTAVRFIEIAYDHWAGGVFVMSYPTPE